MRRATISAALLAGILGWSWATDLRHSTPARAADPSGPAGGAPARANDPAPAADPEPKPPVVVIKAYPIRDLIRPPEDFSLSSAVVPPTAMLSARFPSNGAPIIYSGNKGGQFGRSGTDQGGEQQRIESIERLLENMVDPESWREQGGTVGTMLALDDTLIIGHTQEGHAKIAALLAEVRKTRNTHLSVGIDAYWILLPPGQLRGLLKPAGGAAVKSHDDAPIAGREVDVAAVEALGKTALHTESHLICLSGQTVHVLSGRGHTAVTGANASVGTDIAAYDPEVEQLLAGTAVQLTPTIGSQTATVDVRTTTSEWDQPGEPLRLNIGGTTPTTRPATQPAGNAAHPSATVDRLNTPVHQFATTALLPLGKPILVGGMTLEPSATPRADGRQLYLVLRVSATAVEAAATRPAQ